jgi:CubicO group peptidase (beta-lactamase class C family)
MNKTKILINITVFLSQVTNAQERYLKLDSLLTDRYQNQKFSGVVLVAEGDKITYANSLGYADYAQRIPLNLSTQFELSSGTTLIILTNYGFVDIFELAHDQIEPILFNE